MIWDDMNETPENCPASFSRNFLRRMQDQERGDLVRRPANTGTERELEAATKCHARIAAITGAGSCRHPSPPVAGNRRDHPLLSLYRTALSGFS
jgi:hypothetical protein